MCGIAGVWGADAQESAERVSRMLEATKHRGPDGTRVHTLTRAALGMVRLALVDLTPQGQQPFISSDGRVALVCNGEIYNFRELRRELARDGYNFSSETDAEVALALYLQCGDAFVDRLRGMFAIAILDAQHTRDDEPPHLKLIRDPFGIKPLYWTRNTDGSVVLGSELKAILASGRVERCICPDGLNSYLRNGFVLQPLTLVRGVRCVEPGEIVTFTSPRSSSKNRRYYWLPQAAPRTESPAESAERLRSVLSESIRLHAFADARVGAFLSGGVDSAGVVGFMRKHVEELRTYTLKFTDVRNADEAAAAASTARSLGCIHTQVEVDGKNVAESLDHFARSIDQPSVDGLNTWLVARTAAQDVKGVLSGLGGDEWFGGYPVTRRMLARQSTARGRLLGTLGRLAEPLGRRLPDSAIGRRLQNLAARSSPLSLWRQGHRVFSEPESQTLGGHCGITRGIERSLDARFPQWSSETPLGLSLLLDVDVYMRSQLLRDSDATSMSHSLELRVPLVDVDIASFSRSCADTHKLRHVAGEAPTYEESGAKRVLIDAFAEVLPPDVKTRPKLGFNLPLPTWLAGALKPRVDDHVCRGQARKRGILDPQLVEETRRRFEEQSNPRAWLQTWSLLLLDVWCEQVLDG